MHKLFPDGYEHDKNTSKNPAILLFGHRFCSEQNPLETLVELLLVVYAKKKLGNVEFSTPLPDNSLLRDWPNSEKLQYIAKPRLNLKLFSFLSSTKLPARHRTHRNHFKHLKDNLISKKLPKDSKQDIARTFENLFLGFHGAGSTRCWCAQSFIPITPSLVASETIWKISKTTQIQDWCDIEAGKHFTTNGHNFLARGGELIYLQICNALAQNQNTIKEWSLNDSIGLLEEETDPQYIHRELQEELEKLKRMCPKQLDEIAKLIDEGLDDESNNSLTDYMKKENYKDTGFCVESSWKEGYLFAVSLLRICKSSFEAFDKINMLENACGLQIMQTLLRRSAEYSRLDSPLKLIVTDVSEKNEIIRKLSSLSLKNVEKNIFNSIHDYYNQNIFQDDEFKNKWDTSYGNNLFLATGKRLGIIIPSKGPGARFVFTPAMIKLLVITIVPYSKRITFQKFKEIVQARYGFVTDSKSINDFSLNNGGARIAHGNTDDWLADLLEVSGMLIRLSDSYALVSNNLMGN